MASVGFGGCFGTEANEASPSESGLVPGISDLVALVSSQPPV